MSLNDSDLNRKDWRKQGKYTVVGKVDSDDVSGLRHHVQASADEVVVVRKNGEISDVFSEDRKPTRSFFQSVLSFFGLGSNIEVYKVAKTRFNVVFWLGDDVNIDEDDRSFIYDLPVMTKDGELISARINLWIELDENLPENVLLLLRGRNQLNQFDIASEIHEDLLGKVLSLELNQYTFDELRGNRQLLSELASTIQRELGSALGSFGLRIQDYSINWGLSIKEQAHIAQQKHEISLEQQRNINEIEDLKNRNVKEERSNPIEVVIKPSLLARIVAVISLITAIMFFVYHFTGLIKDDEMISSGSSTIVQPVVIAPPIVIEPTVLPQENIDDSIPIDDPFSRPVGDLPQDSDNTGSDILPTPIVPQSATTTESSSSNLLPIPTAIESHYPLPGIGMIDLIFLLEKI